jgi:hypothetical protein
VIQFQVSPHVVWSLGGLYAILDLHGLGKALPKGETILVPFFCDVFVGEPLPWNGDRRSYMRQLDEQMKQLAAEENFPAWE